MKNILFLGNKNSTLIDFIENSGCKVIQTQSRIDVNFLLDNNIDFVVSYGYRYIIDKPVVKFFEKKIINLHISYLPWNKGASPNLWSVVEETKKGVSIHYVDSTLDTGEIIVQKELHFDDYVSLKESYLVLKREIENLLKLNWDDIVNNKIKSTEQTSNGSFHTVKQTNDLMKKLNIKDWDVTFEEIKNKYEEIKK